MRQVLVAPFIVLALSASCVIVEPTCGSGGGASIIVSPSVVIVSVGGSVTPTASERRCDGRHEERVYPHWSLVHAADSLFIALDATTGRITGRRPGQATVSAVSDQAAAESTVSVTVR